MDIAEYMSANKQQIENTKERLKFYATFEDIDLLGRPKGHLYPL